MRHLSDLSRAEMTAGLGVSLVLSGALLRFGAEHVALPLIAWLRRLPDAATLLLLHGLGLLQILTGLALLALAARATCSIRSASAKDKA